MNYVAIAIAAAVLVIGVLFSQKSRFITQEELPTSEVLSEEKVIEEDSPQEVPVSEDKSSAVATVTRMPTPTLNQTNLADYKYPNSQVVSSTGDSLLLNSTDASETITDWYKEKIRGEGMKVKTFVTTKTNNNVLNKLVGADGEKEIRIEIKKEAGSNTVEISVTADYF